MKKYENFCVSLENMKDIYNYEEPYDNVVLTGLVGLYEITFEQSWKMMKEILEIHGFAEGATSSPKMILRTAYKAGMIKDETTLLEYDIVDLDEPMQPELLESIQKEGKIIYEIM